MTAADILAAHGILRAPEVVELARVGRLELAAACVLLEKESGGGRNVWGHDNVPTGDAYDKGGVVTREDYLAYRTAIRAGRAGRQGVGPCQLTFGPYQDQADAVGGCWDWRANCLTGFRILATLIRVSGTRDGFKAYNGSGPAADKYADDAMRRLTKWRTRLSGSADGPDSLPRLAKGAHAPAVAALQRWLNGYPWSPPLPVLKPDGDYGPATVAVVRAVQAQCGITGPDADGTVVGPRTNAALWARGYRLGG